MSKKTQNLEPKYHNFILEFEHSKVIISHDMTTINYYNTLIITL